MPCNIKLANAQLKLWDYKLLECDHSPIYSPNSSDGIIGVQAVDTFTYSYLRLSHTHIFWLVPLSAQPAKTNIISDHGNEFNHQFQW